MYTSTVLTSIGMLVGAIIYTALVDYVGRLKLFVWPMLGCGVCMSCLGTFFLFQYLNFDMTYVSLVPAASITLYSLLTAIALGSVLLLRNEVFMTEVRAVGIGATYAVLFTGAFASCQLYPVMIQALGHFSTYWMYAGFCLVAVVLVICTLPETKGRSIDAHTDNRGLEVERRSTRSGHKNNKK